MRPKFFLFLFFLFPLFAKAQKIELVNSGSLIDSAAKLYDSSMYKPALALLSRINRSDTNYVQSLYEKAISFEADSQYNNAIKVCQQALALKAQREFEPEIYNTYGNTLNDMGDHDKALKLFDEALAKYPAYSLLYFNKGVVYMAMKKYPDAEEWFKKALLVNPYMYSAHYQLGLAAIMQGKIVPGYISFIGYLLVNPAGRYRANCIKFLSAIGANTDEVLEYKNNRTVQPTANYQEVEDVIASKIALDKAYKPALSLDDAISRQIQATIEKLEYQPNQNDFWLQYYVPYFKEVYKTGKFEPFIFQLFSDVDIPAIQDYHKKNKKTMDAFTEDAAAYFNKIRTTRELFYNRRDTVKQLYVFSEGKLLGRGTVVNNGKALSGAWKGYYPAGNIKSVGQYDALGNKTGDWTWYTFSGAVKAKEHYVNNKLEGPQDYYFANGNLSSHEMHVADQLNGVATTYFYGGDIKSVTTYKAGKKNGPQKNYYSNGKLVSTANYVNDQLNGTIQQYYKNGKLKEVAEYVNDANTGSYKYYHENGALATEGQYVKGKADGIFKYYHDNGKLRMKVVYTADQENGLHEDYDDNGRLVTSYTMKDGKITGDATSYFKDGKVYNVRSYTNGVVTAVKYFDKTGKVLSTSIQKDTLLGVTAYDMNGHKQATYFYDRKGELSGPDTIFFPSGKINQINTYKNGEFEGPSITYYLNGKKKYEVNMTAGKENGYYTSYFANGKVGSEGWEQDGVLQGEWHYYNEAGTLTGVSYFLDGDLDGYKEEYYPNGKKTSEYRYYRGWIEGLTQYDDNGKVIADDAFPKSSGKLALRYPNGKVMAEGTYRNGELDGVYKTLYFDGTPEKIYYYDRGALDSTVTGYYYGGKKHTEGRYYKGSKTGLWKYYDEDGSISYTLNYVMDEADGEKTSYHPDGKKDFTSTYRSDKLEGPLHKYDPNGALAYRMVFEDNMAQSYSYNDKDGKLVADIPIAASNGTIKAYYQNGKPSRECTYSDGVRNGEDRIWYANGNLQSVDHMAYDVSEGNYKTYYENGKLKLDYNYQTDNAHGLCREYYDNGALKKEITFENGLSNGPAKFYDAKGKLIKTFTYYYGNLIAVTNEK